jgi:hypothetical protein
MPSTVAEVFHAASLKREGVVRWREPVPQTGGGVYVVALTDAADAVAGTRTYCPLALDRVGELLNARPELRIEGEPPTPEALAARLRDLWLGDESIVYIGLAGTSLAHRVGAYYRTRIGARRPHAGGWPLKMLDLDDQLWVHFARSNDPKQAEHAMLGAFQDGVSPASRAALEGEWKLPFANLEWGKGQRKKHGITGARERRRRPASSTEIAPEA